MKIFLFLIGFAVTVTAQDNFNGVTCYSCEGTTAPWDEKSDEKLCFDEKMGSIQCSAGEYS